jgi:hypothetical protein
MGLVSDRHTLSVVPEDLHDFVHRVRDISVSLQRSCLAGECFGPSPNAPMPAMEARRDLFAHILHDLAKVFQPLAPKAKIFTSLRDLRADGHYHTFERGGHFSAERARHTQPLSRESPTVKRLNKFVKALPQAISCVDLTGPKYKPKRWEPLRNGYLKEDLCVLMGAVVAKSWDPDKRHANIVEMVWLVCVCANQEDAFNESHLPLLKCCVDPLSMLANVLVRSNDFPRSA